MVGKQGQGQRSALTRLNHPGGLLVDKSVTLYVADARNDHACVGRKEHEEMLSFRDVVQCMCEGSYNGEALFIVFHTLTPYTHLS